MSEDWETCDFEIKKEENIQFGDEKIKIEEPTLPVKPKTSENPPVQKTKKEPKKIVVEEHETDPEKEKERIARSTD